MKLSFSAGAICGNILYFSDGACNALMKLNLLDGKLIYVASFPNEEEQFFIHKQCIKSKDKLYFIPSTGHNIHIYDLKSGNILCIRINRNNPTRLVFNGGILIGDKLWVLPCDITQEVICLNTSTMKVETLLSFEKDLRSYVSNLRQPFWKYCFYEKKVYMALLKTNKIAKYDIENCRMEIIDTEIDFLDSMYRAKGAFWLCTVDGQVYLWDEKINKCQSVVLKNGQSNGGSYVVAESLAGEVYLIPNYGCQIMKKSKEDRMFIGDDELCINNDELEIRRVNFENVDVSENKLVLFPACGSDVVVIDETGVSEVDAILDEKDGIYTTKRNKALKHELSCNTYYEKNDVGLEEYINVVLDI